MRASCDTLLTAPACLSRLRQVVAEAVASGRGAWTLDSTHESGDAESRRRHANRRAHLLRGFGHETQILEEPDTEAVYVWRRG
jgi:hypothetical protein